jgi:hypothetical protein
VRTGTGDELLVSPAEADLPLEDIHGFVLAAVDVEWCHTGAPFAGLPL